MEGGTVKLRTEHAGTVPVAYAEGWETARAPFPGW